VPDSPLLFLTPDLERFRPRAVTFDADGVLHRGRAVLPGAVELIDALDARGIPWTIVTNNSRQTPSVAAAFYRAIGLPVRDTNVSTAAQAMAAYIAAHQERGRPLVFALGDADLVATLTAAGCEVTDDEQVCQWAAVGLDRELSYDKLRRVSDAVRRGARFVAANLDPTIPSETGAIPGVGAIAAAIQVASGVEPTNIGKPGPEMMLQAVHAMGATPGEAVHLGDRIDSDVLGARRAGMVAVLVETGGHTRRDAVDLPTGERPDVVATDLPTIIKWWGL
jgi:HAD superfamily hydrolase (TIGR01450 family)